MANAYYGKNIIGELSDAQTLPNAGSVDSTNMVNIVGPTSGRLWIDVYACTAIAIANTYVLHIAMQGFTADTAASATAPHSIANKSGLPGASGTVLTEGTAFFYLMHMTAGTAGVSWTAGDLICQAAIPEDMFRLLSYDFVQLVYTTTANESSETVDAFVYFKD
uniref:Uncharacterized protein n=1 Tax=viral metagenome TaxID=1070528 RepID=A0A6H1ZPY2_9ZZZZ